MGRGVERRGEGVWSRRSPVLGNLAGMDGEQGVSGTLTLDVV